jgi:hypothetical protein
MYTYLAVDNGMDFESESAAYPAMKHSVHGRRDMPFLNITFIGFLPH